jgi:hypothetical protein
MQSEASTSMRAPLFSATAKVRAARDLPEGRAVPYHAHRAPVPTPIEDPIPGQVPGNDPVPHQDPTVIEDPIPHQVPTPPPVNDPPPAQTGA